MTQLVLKGQRAWQHYFTNPVIPAVKLVESWWCLFAPCRLHYVYYQSRRTAPSVPQRTLGTNSIKFKSAADKEKNQGGATPQSPDLHLIEMLQRDPKRAVHWSLPTKLHEMKECYFTLSLLQIVLRAAESQGFSSSSVPFSDSCENVSFSHHGAEFSLWFIFWSLVSLSVQRVCLVLIHFIVNSGLFKYNLLGVCQRQRFVCCSSL